MVPACESVGTTRVTRLVSTRVPQARKVSGMDPGGVEGVALAIAPVNDKPLGCVLRSKLELEECPAGMEAHDEQQVGDCSPVGFQRCRRAQAELCAVADPEVAARPGPPGDEVSNCPGS